MTPLSSLVSCRILSQGCHPAPTLSRQLADRACICTFRIEPCREYKTSCNSFPPPSPTYSAWGEHEFACAPTCVLSTGAWQKLTLSQCTPSSTWSISPSRSVSNLSPAEVSSSRWSGQTQSTHVQRTNALGSQEGDLTSSYCAALSPDGANTGSPAGSVWSGWGVRAVLASRTVQAVLLQNKTAAARRLAVSSHFPARKRKGPVTSLSSSASSSRHLQCLRRLI